MLTVVGERVKFRREFCLRSDHGKSKHGAGNGESSCGVRVTLYDQSNSKIH